MYKILNVILRTKDCYYVQVKDKMAEHDTNQSDIGHCLSVRWSRTFDHSTENAIIDYLRLWTGVFCLPLTQSTTMTFILSWMRASWTIFYANRNDKCQNDTKKMAWNLLFYTLIHFLLPCSKYPWTINKTRREGSSVLCRIAFVSPFTMFCGWQRKWINRVFMSCVMGAIIVNHCIRCMIINYIFTMFENRLVSRFLCARSNLNRITGEEIRCRGCITWHRDRLCLVYKQ